MADGLDGILFRDDDPQWEQNMGNFVQLTASLIEPDLAGTADWPSWPRCAAFAHLRLFIDNIITQIENEYFGSQADVDWCGQLTLNLAMDIPWCAKRFPSRRLQNHMQRHARP